MHTDHIEKKLGLVFVIAAGLFILEIVGGILSNSLALISDSFHIMFDVVAIGISLIAFRIAKRPHSSTLTFGFHRVEIVAAFVNGISLIAMSAFIFYEAYRRFLNPPEIRPEILLTVASIGLCINIIMAFMLKKESSSNLNVKGSYMHVLGDLLSSVGVIAGAVLIFFLNNSIIDTLVSIGIGFLIIRSGIILCKECLHIFMEGTPKEIKISEVSLELEKLEEITEIHDVHVWTLTSNVFAMSAHVKVKEEFIQNSNALLKRINQIMKEQFGINHCTIQIESEHDLIHPSK
ncbi:MAG: cation diffusion facilitator family transporter [Nitrosopumilaceae archaeon]